MERDEINPYQAPEWVEEFGESPFFQAPRQIPYASRWLRLGGSILDSLFMLFPLFMFLGTMEPTVDEAIPHGELLLLISGGGLLALVVVNLMLIYRRGQTIGKMLCGTVVVTRDFRQASGNRYLFARLLPMWLLGQVPLIGGFIRLADMLLIFREEKNCIHDDIAGTRVVMRRDLFGDGLTP